MGALPVTESIWSKYGRYQSVSKNGLENILKRGPCITLNFLRPDTVDRCTSNTELEDKK